MNDIILNYFKNISEFKKIGHAFLIGNTSLKEIDKPISDVISKMFFDNHFSNLYENVNVMVLEPEKQEIKKSQVIDLQKFIATKSQTSVNKVYVIDGVEFLNEPAANSLLKTLEEPEKDIYAFLITRNILKVMNTIKSRCQILHINEKPKKIYELYDSQIIEYSLNFVHLIEKHGSHSIAHLVDVFSKIPEKPIIKDVFCLIEYFYSDCLKLKNDLPIEYFVNNIREVNEVIEKNSSESIAKKIQIIDKSIEQCEYNLNTLLLFDKIFIELNEVK